MVQRENPDLQLVQKAVKGNRNAFTSLFNRYFQAVYNYSLTLARDPAVAEDLTQEAFIRAHANLHKLGPPYNFRAWIFSLTRNYFIDITRKEKGVEQLEEEFKVVSPNPGPEKEAMLTEGAERVHHTLNSLPGKHREILMLRELQGFSYAEIGEILNLSDSNVKVSLHRARAVFQESFGIQLLMDDPSGDCGEVAALLGQLHDDEDLMDKEHFVREHLKVCAECQQRRQALIEQSVAFAAFIPAIPPKGLAKRILEQTSGPPGSSGPGGPHNPVMGAKILGFGGGAAVLGAMIWIIATLFSNPHKILPNFPTPGNFALESNAPALAFPTATAQKTYYPPSPTPTPTPETVVSPQPPTETPERCGEFDGLEVKLVVLNILDGSYNLPVYLKVTPVVPGGGKTGEIGETNYPYAAWIGDIPSYKCDLQGFPDRLYCMFTLLPDMAGTEQLFTLEMEGCPSPLYAQGVVLPEKQLAEESELVGCHAGLDPKTCVERGGDYRKISDTVWLCFCP